MPFFYSNAPNFSVIVLKVKMQIVKKHQDCKSKNGLYLWSLEPQFTQMNKCECLVGVQGLPAAQGSTAGDVLHPTAIRDHTLLCQHVIKVAGIELCEPILLGDVDLRRT